MLNGCFVAQTVKTKYFSMEKDTARVLEGAKKSRKIMKNENVIGNGGM